MKRKFLFASIAIATLVIGLGVIGASLTEVKIFEAGDVSYSITYGKDNAKLTSDSYLTSETVLTGQTSGGNPANLLTRYAKSYENGLLTLEGGKGYVKTISNITGTTSISITYSFASEDAEARLSLGGYSSEIIKTLTGGTSEKTETFDLTDESSQVDTLSFMVYSIKGDMNIKNVVVHYSCNPNMYNAYTSIDASLLKSRYAVGEKINKDNDIWVNGIDTTGVSDQILSSYFTISLSNDLGATLTGSDAFTEANAGIWHLKAKFSTFESSPLDIVVLSSANPVVPTGITLSESSLMMCVGGKKVIGYGVAPKNANNIGVTFFSNDTSIATVDSSGLVTGKGNGSTSITLTDSAGHTKNVAITVEVPSKYSLKASTQSSHNVNKSYPFTTGAQKILVVPVALSGKPAYTWDEANMQKLINNKNTIKNYYFNASSGALNPDVVIGGDLNNMYKSTLTTEDFFNADKEKNTANRNKLLAEATSWLNNHGYPLADYDTDSNGFVDSIHFMVNGTDYGKWGESYLWPHMESTEAQAPEAGEPPVTGTYSLSNLGHIAQAYTTIHEQGHIYGLEDYYDYNRNSTANMVAKADMQSSNKFDWNSFSKLQVGWNAPYVPSLSKGEEVSITIEPSALTGDCIAIGTDWNGSAYDEYILVELFTKSGNNTSFWPQWGRDLGEGGVRLYHVDARLWGYSGNGINSGGYVSGKVSDTTKEYFIPATNTTNNGYATTRPSSVNPDFNLLHLIQKSGFNSNRYSATTHYLEYSDLFTTGDTFALSSHTGFTDYSSFLPLKTTMNNGSTFDYGLSFESVTSSKATIKITAF